MMQSISANWLEYLAYLLAFITVVHLGKLAFDEVNELLEMRKQFSPAGIWVGPCKLPRHPPGVEALEIYRLAVRGGRVKFRIFHYLPEESDFLKYKGKGIWRGSQISAFYYIPAGASYESGVFVVRLIGGSLRGFYAQYDPQTPDEELQISKPETFTLQRLKHVPLWQRVKMSLGMKPYQSYDEVLALCEKSKIEVVQQPPTTPAAQARSTPAALPAGPSAPPADDFQFQISERSVKVLSNGVVTQETIKKLINHLEINVGDFPLKKELEQAKSRAEVDKALEDI